MLAGSAARSGWTPARCSTCSTPWLLLRALVRERLLRHGNEQVALPAMLQFLALNGWDMGLTAGGHRGRGRRSGGRDARPQAGRGLAGAPAAADRPGRRCAARPA
jgi:hypothetical protein